MKAGGSGGASGSLKRVVGGDGVDVAGGADAMVAGEDLVAEVAGIGAESPLVDAVVGAEGAAAFGEDFELAPAAERQIVRATWKSVACGAASEERAGREHAFFRIGWVWQVGDDDMGSGWL